MMYFALFDVAINSFATDICKFCCLFNFQQINIILAKRTPDLIVEDYGVSHFLLFLDYSANVYHEPPNAGIKLPRAQLRDGQASHKRITESRSA